MVVGISGRGRRRVGRRNERIKWLQQKGGRGTDGRKAEVWLKTKKNIRCVNKNWQRKSDKTDQM